MKYYDVIYQLTDEIRARDGGRARSRADRDTSSAVPRSRKCSRPASSDKAAGLLVTDGIIRKGLYARLTRDDVIV